MKRKEFSVPFKSDTRCRLITADRSSPLIIYLHGYKQNIKLFERKVSNLLELNAHHLLMDGPYPIYDEKRNVENWGRAWYLYDGRQQQFRQSMEQSSQFIEQAIEMTGQSISYSRVIILGYSMGGYLAGYFALSRPKIIDDLIVVGGRIKTEWFADQTYKNLDVLALHGQSDITVELSATQQASLALKNMGASTTFKTVAAKHHLTKEYIEEIRGWLKDRIE